MALRPRYLRRPLRRHLRLSNRSPWFQVDHSRWTTIDVFRSVSAFCVPSFRCSIFLGKVSTIVTYIVAPGAPVPPYPRFLAVYVRCIFKVL